MRNTRKILVALLVLMTILVSLVAVAIPASAASAGNKIYLKPNSNWKQDNAWFSAWFFGGTAGDKMVKMTDDDGDGVYELTMPDGGYTKIIFVRNDPAKTALSWDSKWSQTGDLSIPSGGTNLFTLNDGSWDQGTWSTLNSSCTHANLGEKATCATPQVCLDCGDPVVAALGHTYNSAHLCTRCNGQATFTVAGSGAHMNGEWAPSNAKNDMTYADGVYTKVYTNVAAGSYLLKVARDHDWGTAYPSADKAYTVDTAGSTVTVTLKGTVVTINVEAPHVHSWSDATCTEAQKCACGETQGDALGHDYVKGVCSRCEAVDPDYVPETPHVNTLVVGDTNKIVVDGDTFNDYNLPIEWVLFVADENAFYSFVGDNGALSFIFSAEGALISATGAANLEAGNYLICVGNGLVGEFNVAVTKSAWVNTLVEGANKILITDALDNGAGYYIAWAPFEVTEKANYTFTGEGILALVYDSAYKAVSGTELEVGTYNVCVAFLTKETTGVATVNVAKTAIGGGEVVEPELPALQLGDNTVTIDGSQVNLVGTAVAWYTFTPETAGTYTLACDDLTIFILTSKNMSDPNAYVGAGGVAELEAGTTYYVLVGKEDIRGEFTVNVSLGGEAPVANSIVVGNNVYVINQPLKDTGYEFLYFTADKDGIYTFSGLKNLVFFIWPEFPNQATVSDTDPYVWNIDLLTGMTTDSVEVELTAATYLIGFKYVAKDEAGNDLSLVGEYNIVVSFEEKAAHEHNFVEGKCECGETDPNYQPPVDDEPAPELNPIQKIIAAITAFFAKITAWFKGFIGGLKK